MRKITFGIFFSFVDQKLTNEIYKIIMLFILYLFLFTSSSLGLLVYSEGD